MTVHSIHYSWICKVHILSSTKLVSTNSHTGNLPPATVIVKHTLTNSTLTLLLTSLSLITNTLNSHGKSQEHYIKETIQTILIKYMQRFAYKFQQFVSCYIKKNMLWVEFARMFGHTVFQKLEPRLLSKISKGFTI